MTLRERLIRYFKNHPDKVIASGDIQRLVMQETDYTPSNASRRLRELAEDGLLRVEYKKGHAHYRFIKKELTV